MQADALSQTFAAFADPTRRAISKRLAAGPANVKELSRPFDMSGPAVCKHLRVLERAGLVRRRRDSNDRPTVNAMMPEWPVGAHIVMMVELVATARGTRMIVAQRVAEPELADSPPIVRHRKLAAIGWSQTA
ncbi:MAG: winged helix-turn-helix transcriptional regulator [Labilithrix sp.]|nr:winged helix-turn-helix transcriptional regulator [Labilithrix sp.]